MIEIQEILKIADIHVNRIQSAIKHVQHLFPIDAETLKKMHETDLAWLDLLINRFGKLQDLIGSKIIDLFLENNEENISSLTMLDKIHKLEKLEIIDDAEIWKEMRQVRNHVAHEYPEKPDIMAKYINKIFYLVPQLLIILQNIKNRL